MLQNVVLAFCMTVHSEMNLKGVWSKFWGTVKTHWCILPSGTVLLIIRPGLVQFQIKTARPGLRKPEIKKTQPGLTRIFNPDQLACLFIKVMRKVNRFDISEFYVDTYFIQSLP